MSAQARRATDTPGVDAWAERSVHGASGRRYFDSRLGAQIARVLPGDFQVTRDDMGLATTLGSCVSACLRDAQAGVGGINHFMLAESELSSANVTSARYGGYAMEVLINELLKQGARRRFLEAKVFGGGNVLPGMATLDVGMRNAEFARNYLCNEQIPIVAEDLGGNQPRKIVYFPRTGRVLVMRLSVAQNRSDIDAERRYQETLQRAPVGGDVELFD